MCTPTFLKESIKQLDTNRIPVAELEAYANRIELLLAEMPRLGLTPNLALQRNAQLLKSTVKPAQAVMAEAAALRQAYEATQQRRDVTKRIVSFLELVENARKVSLPDSHHRLHGVDDGCVFHKLKKKANCRPYAQICVGDDSPSKSCTWVHETETQKLVYP